MTRRSLVPLGFALLAAACLAPSVRAAGVGLKKTWLPDSTVLARVDGRPIRASEFVREYFHSYAEFRPSQDSTGRVEFLNNLVNKEVMTLTARAVKRPLAFEDRLQIREDTERALGNTLFQRAVLDSAVVTDDEIRQVYETYKYDQRFRQIIFDDKPTAEQVRADLIAGRIKWDDAVRRYHHAERDTVRGTDLGWVSRDKVDPNVAPRIFGLQPNEISAIIFDRAGYRIIQSVERRPARAASFATMRRIIRAQLVNEKSAVLADRLKRMVGSRIGLTHDSTAIAWAASQFKQQRSLRREGDAPVLELDASLPVFADADTGRVLAHHRDGRVTVADFIHAYSELPPLSRPEVSDPDEFRSEVDAIALAPYMAQEATARGLDRDSMTVATLTRRRDQMMVDHLYQDSVASKVYVDARARRKYYDDHIAQYHTYAKVVFAAITRATRSGADSVVAALKAGKKAADILRADSLGGLTSGAIRERREDEKGAPYQRILFNELRQGQSTLIGPDRDGVWMVLNVVSNDPGRQLSYKEAEAMVDESAQNIASDRALKALLARQKKRHRIETHPERVMRIELADKSED
ncbi:MAG: peptidyl-prolyl cis-trans isomerase [Candidatus Eisenbacteria bacterium]|nr:peptidyl-prolyl cis-trans isomerase [Candidatus Eisenbacteria bacterium]